MRKVGDKYLVYNPNGKHHIFHIFIVLKIIEKKIYFVRLRYTLENGKNRLVMKNYLWNINDEKNDDYAYCIKLVDGGIPLSKKAEMYLLSVKEIPDLSFIDFSQFMNTENIVYTNENDFNKSRDTDYFDWASKYKMDDASMEEFGFT